MPVLISNCMVVFCWRYVESRILSHGDASGFHRRDSLCDIDVTFTPLGFVQEIQHSKNANDLDPLPFRIWNPCCRPSSKLNLKARSLACDKAQRKPLRDWEGRT